MTRPKNESWPLIYCEIAAQNSFENGKANKTENREGKVFSLFVLWNAFDKKPLLTLFSRLKLFHDGHTGCPGQIGPSVM